MEDLYSGEERRSDKYMYMTPNEMWKEKIIKGQVTFVIYSKRVVLGGESYSILGTVAGIACGAWGGLVSPLQDCLKVF